MPLSIGDKLGHYEVISLLGKGGMGEVYRARDTRLKREVAIKVLPETFARDPGRMARFHREAEVLASLNHPNIATIHGVEDRALVMELVEGSSPKGPLPFEEAWKIASQIAVALEYAHERGIIHRDLKPANILITSEGVVKLLDFGLAKAFSNQRETSASPENSPTLTMGATEVGVILGTAAYMAPEQARGKVVDKRADIWSFGVVLYELVTGQRLFSGEDAAETLAAVIHKQPDLGKVPRQARRLLEGCLQKDPKQRLRDIGDAKRLIGGEEPPAPFVAANQGAGRLVWPAVAAVATLALAALAFLHFRENPPAALIQRFEIAVPSATLGVPIISPDGLRLAIMALGANGKSQLWVRPLDSLEAHPLPGTEGVGGYPFWSPDGRYIGFFAGGKLMRIDAAGGSAQMLFDTGNGSGGGVGGFWTSDGKIVFNAVLPKGRPDLFEVPESGGTASPLPGVEHSAKEIQDEPAPLPDGRHFVYARYASAAPGPVDIYLGSLEAKPSTRNAKRLLTISDPRFAFAPSPDDPNLGYLLFLQRPATPGAATATLMAQPFDLRKLDVASEPVLVADRVLTFSVSSTGILAYLTGSETIGDQLTLFDGKGNALQTIGEPGYYRRVSFSPQDGTRVAAYRVDQPPAKLWMFDLARGLASRFISDPATAEFPVWSPDGIRIAFASNRGGKFDIYQRLSNGGGEDELLSKSDQDRVPLSWSGNGHYLLIGATSQADATNWVLSLDDKGKPVGDPYLFVRKGLGIYLELSPDPVGPPHWVAYQSNHSGRPEIYLLPFDPKFPTGSPPTAGEHQVSIAGGRMPRWNSNGKELFFLAPDGTVMAAELTGNPKILTSTPHAVFKPKGILGPDEWDVSPDGKKFLFPIPIIPRTTAPTFTVVLNWTSLLKK